MIYPKFAKYSSFNKKQTLLFNKKLCKYCRNRVDSQEGICTHCMPNTHTHMRINIDEWLCTNQIIIKVESDMPSYPDQILAEPLAMFGQKLEAYEQSLLKGAAKTFASQNYSQEKFI